MCCYNFTKLQGKYNQDVLGLKVENKVYTYSRFCIFIHFYPFFLGLLMLEFMVFQGILLLRLSAQLVKLNLLLEMLKGKLFLDPKKRKKKENQCTSWGWLIRVFYCQNFLCYLSFNGLLLYAVCCNLFKILYI